LGLISKIVTLVSLSPLFINYPSNSRPITQVRKRNDQLRRYEHDWAIYEIIRTSNKNKRSYGKKIGRSNSQDQVTEEPDDDAEMSEVGDEEESQEDGQEEGTSSSGKRTKMTQGGTDGKRVRT
jgi:hypothetical protein